MHAMKYETSALLDAFDQLPEDEKRTFTKEVLLRSFPFNSGGS